MILILILAPNECTLSPYCTWLPTSASGVEFNVEDEIEDETSVLNYYKWLIEFRQRDEFTRGKQSFNAT